MYLLIRVVLKFCEEWIKITLISLLCHFLIKKVLKKPIFDQKGGQNWKFQKIQKSTSRQLKYPGCVQI